MADCPKCGYKNVEMVGTHQNRRLKRPVNLYKCNNCRFRFAVKGNPALYNHKGNIRKRKKLCACGKRLSGESDTEITIQLCFGCVVAEYEEYGYYVADTLGEWLQYLCDEWSYRWDEH